jgi:hypothetical protein
LFEDVEPATTAFPSVAGMYPVRIRIVVVFPAPFGPQESEDFTALDAEAHIVDRGDAAIPFGEVLNLNHRTPLSS